MWYRRGYRAGEERTWEWCRYRKGDYMGLITNLRPEGLSVDLKIIPLT